MGPGITGIDWAEVVRKRGICRATGISARCPVRPLGSAALGGHKRHLLGISRELLAQSRAARVRGESRSLNLPRRMSPRRFGCWRPRAKSIPNGPTRSAIFAFPIGIATEWKPSRVRRTFASRPVSLRSGRLKRSGWRRSGSSYFRLVRRFERVLADAAQPRGALPHPVRRRRGAAERHQVSARSVPEDRTPRDGTCYSWSHDGQR